MTDIKLLLGNIKGSASAENNPKLSPSWPDSGSGKPVKSKPVYVYMHINCGDTERRTQCTLWKKGCVLLKYSRHQQVVSLTWATENAPEHSSTDAKILWLSFLNDFIRSRHSQISAFPKSWRSRSVGNSARTSWCCSIQTCWYSKGGGNKVGKRIGNRCSGPFLRPGVEGW